MVEKTVSVTFKVLKKGQIIHKLNAHTSILFDQNGTMSLTPYKLKKGDVVGELTLGLPESLYKNVYVLPVHRESREIIAGGLRKAKEIIQKRKV